MATAQKNTLAAFKAQFDPSIAVPIKVKAAFEAMKKAGDDWHYEAEFIKLAGINQLHASQFREQFADHVVEVRVTRGSTRKVWFHDAKMAKASLGG